MGAEVRVKLTGFLSVIVQSYFLCSANKIGLIRMITLLAYLRGHNELCETNLQTLLDYKAFYTNIPVLSCQFLPFVVYR